MKRLSAMLCIALSCLVAIASEFPATMYIKSAWNGSKWEWKEMTTTSDGIYTYEAPWKNFTGCNIHTKASDNGSAWFKKSTILGYDASVIVDDADVIFTYLAACERLYVALKDAPSVYLLISGANLEEGDEAAVSMFCYNIPSPVYACSVVSPSMQSSTVGNSMLFDEVGEYLFTVTATSATDSSCSATLSMSVKVAESSTPVPCPFTPTADELKRCYHEDASTHDITFLYSPEVWGKTLSSITTIHVSGSFNGWSSSSDDTFKMKLDPDREIYYLTVPYATVKRPGNSGQPEYKMVVNGSYASTYSGFPSDYIFRNADNNMIVVFAFDDFDQIKANSAAANLIKDVADFDLTTQEGREAISNFRCVPGTKHLFRCYHPFKTSRTFATEPVRMEMITQLAVENAVMSDICLSGDDTGNIGSYTVNGVTHQETIPAYYQEMLSRGDVLYVGQGYKTPSYNEVYYNSTSDTFGRWVKDVVDFINDSSHEAPFTIHCRLGTDRTGVFCAVLAAFCDAPWDDITADYQLTNRMSIQEFRDYHLLQYSFERMLGVDHISEVPDVSAAVKNYFTEKGYLSAADIEAAAKKLKESSSAVGDVAAEGQRSFSVNGRSVLAGDLPVTITAVDGTTVAAGVREATLPAAGVYIVADGLKATKIIAK